MKDNVRSKANTEIAIIGMACRFPGASDPSSFWANLAAGQESISFFDASSTSSSNPDYRDRPNFRCAAGALPDVDKFDGEFFGYSAHECELMDPQHRLFLECAWETFEDAGIVPTSIAGSVGVYAGCGINTYLINNVHPANGYSRERSFLESSEDLKVLLGNQSDFISTRVSYKLDLRGPSVNLQTACSTSLVAIHLACQSLILGECELALAGCSTIRLPQDGGYLVEEGMVSSEDGHTRSFDACSGGTVFGSGVAAILLKPLRTAILDGDPIQAVIKGSAINNDGGRKLSFTSPSVDGQEAVIREALSAAGVEPSSIGYVEAHGTGTTLGDPMEVAALRKAFGDLPPGSCALGSVKSNFGHLSWSAGMAGLIKVVLALKNGKIPPTIHFKSPNPLTGLEGSPFQVVDRLTDWKTHNNGPRRASVSAFGIGGTNAHIVLQEAPPPDEVHAEKRRWHTLALSARTRTALTDLKEKYRLHLVNLPDSALADVCYTTNTARISHRHRFSTSASSMDMLCSQLSVPSDLQPVGQSGCQQDGGEPRVAFLFAGLGSHHAGMGRDLYDTQATFRNALQECDPILKELGCKSATELIYGGPCAYSALNDIRYTHVAMFAFEYALARMWMGWGVVPAAVMGHSAGEYVAACIAGVVSLSDALMLAAERGRLFDEKVSSDGIMATASAAESCIVPLLAAYGTKVSIAAINGPLSTVISGERESVEAVCSHLASKGIVVKILDVTRAGHSALTDPILSDLRLAAMRIRFYTPSIPFVSNVTGQRCQTFVATPDYWCQHTRGPVLFSKGLQTLDELGITHYLEIGPDATLTGMGAYCLPEKQAEWIPSLRRQSREIGDAEDWRHVSAALARLYTAGFSVNWEGVYDGQPVRRISLPTYPFQRIPHWIHPPRAQRFEGTRSTSQHSDLLQLEWIESEPLSNSHQTCTGTWIILPDTDGLAERLHQRLQLRGQSSRILHLGSPEGRTYLFDSSRPSIVDCLDEHAGQPIGVIDVRACSGSYCKPPESGVSALIDSARVCGDFLGLIRALLPYVGNSPLRVLLATRACQSVTSKDRLEGLATATAWAASRVVGIEHPELSLSRIDLPMDMVDSDESCMLDAMLLDDLEDTVAIRGGRRLVGRLSAVGEQDPIANPGIQPHGCYLITGGLGGIGLLLSEWLVQQGARHLILMGRRPAGPDALAVIARVRKVGARVNVVNADVADADAMERIFQTLSPQTPMLGVFHAAGVIDDAVASQLSEESLMRVLNPKVNGSWNLHVLCTRYAPDLEHFVLFSSAASLLGNAGQTAHAAANAFLDSLAHHRQSLNLPALSVNWGAWSEVGELRSNTVARENTARRGFRPISSADGLKALSYAMKFGIAQVAASPMDWSKFLSNFRLERLGLFSKVAPPDNSIPSRAGAEFPAHLRRANVEDRHALLRACVRTQVAHVLGLTPMSGNLPSLKDDRRLTEYGLDSLSSIDLRSRLQSQIGQPLPAALVVQSPTIRDIVNHLAQLNYSNAPILTSEIDVGNSFCNSIGLSAQQERWLTLIRAGYGARVVPIVFRVELDQHLFRAALSTVVSHHELLRYVFPGDRIEVLATADAIPSDENLYHDISDLDKDDQSSAISGAMDHCWASMPDPASSPSWTLKCIRRSSREFLLLLSLQHLDFDGSSLTTFVSELRAAYAALMRGEEPPISEVPQYRSYVSEQRKYLSERIQEDRAFFQGLFTGLVRTTRLPGHTGFDRVLPLESSRFTLTVPSTHWESIQRLAVSLGVTQFSIMMAAYARLVSEITEDRDVVISMITNGRVEKQFQSTIGPFTAPFPVRVTCASIPLSDAATQCHQTVASIIARSSYPVSDLVTSIPAFNGFPSDTYFSDASINFTNYRKDDDGVAPDVKVIEILGPVTEPDLECTQPATLQQVTGLYLVLDLSDDTLRANFWYHSSRFSKEQVADWATRYVSFLDPCG